MLAGIPYGLGVASINIGKHIDKHDDDKAKGVGTFPVRVGEAFARRVDQVALILIYAVIAIPGLCAALFHTCHADRFPCIQACAGEPSNCSNNPRPAQPPQGWPAWPTWFSAVTFFHNRQFGGWLILGLIVDTLLTCHPVYRGFLARYWPLTQLSYVNILDFQPRGFGVFQNSEPDFSFRGECRVLIVDPDDQSQRGIRTHLRLKHLEHHPLRTTLAPRANRACICAIE